MAKRSPIQAIKLKQSSAYKAVPRTAPAIHALPTIKSWNGTRSGRPSPKALDEQAEKTMSAGWTKRNKICPIHYILRSNSGECIECDA